MIITFNVQKNYETNLKSFIFSKIISIFTVNIFFSRKVQVSNARFHQRR